MADEVIVRVTPPVTKIFSVPPPLAGRPRFPTAVTGPFCENMSVAPALAFWVSLANVRVAPSGNCAALFPPLAALRVFAPEASVTAPKLSDDHRRSASVEIDRPSVQHDGRRVVDPVGHVGRASVVENQG